MGEKDIRSIALFFFFAFLDESRAREAAAFAVASAREQKKRNPNDDPAKIVVQVTEDGWSRRKKFEGESPELTGREWVLPSSVNVRSWTEFAKIASPEELTTVIWSAILGYSDECIADALNLSTGTVRYRWGHALEKLGRLVGPRAVPR